ncbi:MAG: hypothetical protein IKU34_02555 [Clostridia bacterium]|nr:hypothetical protein [Clostridia bacterium]
MRDRSIDTGRGLLVLMMVYGHVMQFFGDASLFPLTDTLINIINLTVFPTFVFYFGATAVLAYLDKPYKRALPGMAKTTLRSLVAFYLSGIGYRILREKKPFAVGTVRKILWLEDIPGWSEFLVSFALYSLLLIVAFKGLQWLSHRPLAALAVGAACLAASILVPYGAVKPAWLQLIIGGRDFACFPIVQYMPYFLAGMIFARGGRAMHLRLLAIAAVCSAAGIAAAVIDGGLPGRFPPQWSWIVLPALLCAAVVAASKGICALGGGGIRRAADMLRDALSHFGSRSLYYLLTSNLVLFTLSGAGIAPVMKRKSVLPWTAVIQSPKGALVWTGLLLAALWFVTVLAGRSAKKK